MEMQAGAILEVRNLVTAFELDDGSVVKAVDGISFTVHKGQTLGIVGESGCGKSVTSFSIMRLLPRPAGRILGGEILFRLTDKKGNTEIVDICKLPAQRLHEIRGNRIAMIFQEPMTALNPVHTIRRQMAEVFELHYPEMTSADIYRESIDLLNKVAMPEPEIRIESYPHQLSGGMRQRVMIAMALACKPDILIADEPTTALDVTIQAQILELMKKLQKETGMAVIFITHALGVIAQLCDDVIVMYGGRIAESGTIEDIFENPVHPYTKGLLDSIPKLDSKRRTKLKVIDGMVPSLADFPPGCRFQNRCPYAKDNCLTSPPPLEQVIKQHDVACFYWNKLEHV